MDIVPADYPEHPEHPSRMGPQRMCRECGQPRPLVDFEEEMGDAASFHPTFVRNTCVSCRRHMRRLKNAKKKDEREARQRETAIKQVLVALKGNKLSAPHITELADEIFKRFGGVEQFTAEWHAEIQLAREAKPGSKTVLDAYRDLGRLVAASTEHRASAPDLSDLSMEDLDEVLRNVMPQLYDPGEEDDLGTAESA